MRTVMNPDDLIKAATAIAKGVGALVAAIPFTAMVRSGCRVPGCKP